MEGSFFDGVNGFDDDGNLWVDGKKAKISKRKPKQKKDGSANWKKDIPKTGTIRGGGMVGGVVDAQGGTHKGTIKNPTESTVENKIDSSKE